MGMINSKGQFISPRKVMFNPRHHPLLAIDVENNPETGDFIIAGLYGDYRPGKNKPLVRVNRTFNSEKELGDFLMSIEKTKENTPCLLVGFNWGYDYYFLREKTDDSKKLATSSRFITGELKSGIKLLDLANLTNEGSLADWIEYLNLEEKGIFKPDLTDLVLRVKMDVRATYELGTFLEDFFVYEAKIPLKLTIAGAARELFVRHFLHESWGRKESQSWINEYERKSYRGGRTEAFYRGQQTVNSYDVHGMYLSIQRDCSIPNPNSAKYLEKPSWDILKDKMYIADVTVYVPEQHIPPLPYYTDKLIFPTGVFRGHYCSPELTYAVEKGYAEIVKIHSAMVYTAKPYFKDFADFVWKKRKEYKAKGNKGMDIMIKTIGNSLYGGWGQRNNSSKSGNAEHIQVPEGADYVTFRIGGIDYVSYSMKDWYWSRHSFPCISSVICSYARKKLLVKLKENEEDVVYCDTDSVHLRAPLTMKDEKELGKFGYEYSRTQIYYTPKFYTGKHKGVPKRAKFVSRQPDGFTFEYEKPNKEKESIRRKKQINKWEQVVKTIHIEDTKRKWDTVVSEPHKIYERIGLFE